MLFLFMEVVAYFMLHFPFGQLEIVDALVVVEDCRRWISFSKGKGSFGEELIACCAKELLQTSKWYVWRSSLRLEQELNLLFLKSSHTNNTRNQ